LKKRSKELLSPAVHASRNARARVQKFFGSFFQKRTSSFKAQKQKPSQPHKRRRRS
jgi:hypothetical protein